jgi:hypothetical protein
VARDFGGHNGDVHKFRKSKNPILRSRSLHSPASFLVLGLSLAKPNEITGAKSLNWIDHRSSSLGLCRSALNKSSMGWNRKPQMIFGNGKTTKPT